MALPELRAGVYRHWKGHLYLVLGYGEDANNDGRVGVVYIGLQLDGARPGARLRFRDVADFFDVVSPQDRTLRFTYLGPGWDGNGR